MRYVDWSRVENAASTRVKSRKGGQNFVDIVFFVEQSRHSQYLTGSLAFMRVLNREAKLQF